MKKSFKAVAAMLLVVVMMLSLTACGGIDMNKVKGDWTLSTIGGKTITDVANEKGMHECFLYLNYTITDTEIKNDALNTDGSGAHVNSTFTLKKRSNGVEGYLGDQLAISLIYDEKADTLSMKLGESESTAVEYIFVKGSKNLDEAYQIANSAGISDGSSAGASEGASEGGEEETYSEGEEDYE